MRMAMILLLLLLFGITCILGCFVIERIHQIFFNQVDVVLDAGHGGKDPGANRNDAIEKETTKRTQENGTDKLARALTRVPSPLIKLGVNTLMWLDKHNLHPKAVIDLSPFHTSFFITNLKSLGINYIHHHTYNFGTTGLFFAMGKEKMLPISKGNELVHQKHMGFGLVSDERFCDGLYFAMSLRLLRKIMRNPATLETPLDKKTEDVK